MELDETEQLKEIISSYWQISGQEIEWGTEFNSQRLNNFSSLRMLRFLASIEDRFKINIEDVDSIKSFQDLRQLVKKS